MSELQLLYFFWAIIGLSVVIIASALFKMGQFKKEDSTRTQIGALKGKRAIPITVLIYAKHTIELVEPTLASLYENNYSAVDVVIIYEGNEKFNTTQFNVPLIRRRVRGTIHEAYKAGYRKSKKAKTIVTLQAGKVVDTAFLKRVAITAGAKPLQTVYCAAHDSNDDESLLGLIRSTSKLVWHKQVKSEVFKARYFNKVSLLDPIHLLSTGAMYISFVLIILAITYGSLLNDFTFVWYVWILFTIYLLAMIWLDSKEALHRKVQLTFLSPSALFLLPITSCVLGFSQLYKRK